MYKGLELSFKSLCITATPKLDHRLQTSGRPAASVGFHPLIEGESLIRRVVEETMSGKTAVPERGGTATAVDECHLWEARA